MNEATINTVLELFEKHRKLPGEEFYPDYFFDFLMNKPKGKGAFRNSFLGLRRFNAFWGEVQLRFGVCFSVKDRESDYSLNRFCERIEELKSSNGSSKASLRNRAKYGFERNVFVFGNAILVGFSLAVSGIFLLSTSIWIGLAYLNYKLITSYLKEKCYINMLEAKIDSGHNI